MDVWQEPHVGAPRSRRGPIVIVAVVILIIVLSLGLGLGLGLRNDEGSNESEGTGELWHPAVGSKWQIVLLKPIEVNTDNPSLTPDVDIWDIDLFTNSKETIAAVKSLGKKVICYFSAGSFEHYRPDSDRFKKADMGSELDGWPGEYWLNLGTPNVRSIMTERISLAREKGCDAIDPDNVDGFVSPYTVALYKAIYSHDFFYFSLASYGGEKQNENGLGLTRQQSIDFMRFIASESARHGMSCGLKNAGDIISDLLDVVQFSVNEQCAEYGECDAFTQFIDNGKPVFQIEYPGGAPDSVDSATVDTICSRKGNAEGSANFSTVIKGMDLDGWVQYCDGEVADSALGKFPYAS